MKKSGIARASPLLCKSLGVKRSFTCAKNESKKTVKVIAAVRIYMYSTCVAFGNMDIAEAAYAIFKANVTLMRVFDVCHCSRSMDEFTMSTILVAKTANAAHHIRNVLVENATRPEDRGGDDVSVAKKYDIRSGDVHPHDRGEKDRES